MQASAITNISSDKVDFFWGKVNIKKQYIRMSDLMECNSIPHANLKNRERKCVVNSFRFSYGIVYWALQENKKRIVCFFKKNA